MQVGVDLMLEASPQAVRRKSIALVELFIDLVGQVRLPSPSSACST